MYAYQIIKNERPHLIHAHSSKGGVLGRLVGKWLNIKVLYTPQAFSYLSTENTYLWYVLEDKEDEIFLTYGKPTVMKKLFSFLP